MIRIVCPRCHTPLNGAELEQAAEKLRHQDSLAGGIRVYIRTNVFKPEVPQYQRSVTVPLPNATDDTCVLTRWALRVLRRIYQPGYGYHTAGIMLSNIVPAANQQFSLFASGGAGDGRSKKLMVVLDGINGKYGRGSVKLAAEGVEKAWQMRRGNLSPRYTTEWACLPVVQAR
jgi:DNA polymerase V